MRATPNIVVPVGPRRGLFLDRDGVLLCDVGYLSDPSQMSWLPGAREACGQLYAAGWMLFVVTNQSGVGRGLFPVALVRVVHEYMRRDLQHYDADLLDLRYATSLPGQQDHGWRKPGGNMLLSLARTHKLDLRRSALVDDKEENLGAARRVGCAAFHVPKDVGLVAALPALLQLAARADGEQSELSGGAESET